MLLDKTHTLMPEEIHQVLHPFIENLDGDTPEVEPSLRLDLNMSAGDAAEESAGGEVHTADGASGDEVAR